MKTVKIRPLKELAISRLPKNSHLRELILLENDVLKADEFLILMRTWLRLLKIESKDK
jgi:hypothetical protein